MKIFRSQGKGEPVQELLLGLIVMIMMIIMSNMIMMKEITTKDNCEPINKDCLFNRSNCLQSDLLTKRCICLS